MLNLALECSGTAGSIALLQGHELWTEVSLPADMGSVRSLALTIEELLERHVRHAGRQIELISVTCGPGSFTGLRVGLATAQMLGMAWGIPIAPVDTLAAIARQTYDWHQSHHPGLTEQESLPPVAIVPVLNAFRKQVFAAGWWSGESALREVAVSQVVDAALWQAEPWRVLKTTHATSQQNHQPGPAQAAFTQTAPKDPQVLVSGPGLNSYQPAPQLGLRLADPVCWSPMAGTVGQLGWDVFQQQRAVKAGQLRPNYVRASAAEEQSSKAHSSRLSP